MTYEKCSSCTGDTEFKCRVARISLDRMLLAIDMDLSPAETTAEERQAARTSQREHNIQQIINAGCSFSREQLRETLPERANKNMADFFGYDLIDDEPTSAPE